MNAEHRQERLEVKVTTAAARSEIAGVVDGVLHVRVAAPPVRGKANRELTELLSRALGVSKSDVSIARGQASRRKVIAVTGLDRDEILRRLSP